MKRLRVLAVTTSFPSGPDDPAGGFVEELASALRPQGIDTVVAKFPSLPGGALAQLERGGLRGRAALVGATARLALEARRPADVVLAHWLVPSAIVAIGTRPVIGVAHGGDVRLLARLPGLQRALVARLAGVIAVSHDIAERLGHPNTLVTPMGIWPPVHAPPPRRPHAGPLRLAFVGRLEPIKGLGVLLEATRDLSGVVLTVAGDGPDRRLAEGAPHARFLGAISPAEVRELLGETDLLCVPSVGAEGMPRVVFEAASVGCPTLASRIGGLPEHLAEQALVAPGDVHAWRAALEAAATRLPPVSPYLAWDAVAAQVASFIYASVAH